MAHPPEYNECVKLLTDKYGEIEVMNGGVKKNVRHMTISAKDQSKVMQFELTQQGKEIVPYLVRSVALT